MAGGKDAPPLPGGPRLGRRALRGGDRGRERLRPHLSLDAYVYLTGKTDLTPPEMAAFSERNGYVENGMTAWRLITEGSALLGLRAEELPASEGVVAGVLDAGYPVICSMGPGDFTTVGHFIVLCGRDENGDARVYDPNSPERSAQGWPIETVLGQALNLWELARE